MHIPIVIFIIYSYIHSLYKPSKKYLNTVQNQIGSPNNKRYNIIIGNTSHKYIIGPYKGLRSRKKECIAFMMLVSRAVTDRPTRECLPSSRLSYCTCDL